MTFRLHDNRCWNEATLSHKRPYFREINSTAVQSDETPHKLIKGLR